MNMGKNIKNEDKEIRRKEIYMEEKTRKKAVKFTENDVIQLTDFVVRNFYQRNIAAILPYFAPDFVWIGAWEYQYVKGREYFLATVDTESKAPPSILTDREYHLLIHEKNLWIIYGRYTSTVIPENSPALTTKTRNTYVWKQQGDQLVLLHIHGSNAHDVPLNADSTSHADIHRYNDWFAYLNAVRLSLQNETSSPSAIHIREIDGSISFLQPCEIRYICSNKNLRYIYTNTQVICTKTTLAALKEKLPGFILIHRAYLVDQKKIRSLKRYEAALSGGETLPVGKSMYMELKEKLKLGE